MPPEQTTTIKPKEGTRKILAVVYIFSLVLSLLMAFGSIFVFDGDDRLELRYGVFWSHLILPITIIISLFLARKSLKWYLLPLIPLVCVLYFNYALSDYINKSNMEFCQQMLQEYRENPSPETAHNLCD